MNKKSEESSSGLFGEQQNVSEQTFEELIARLEEIVNQMENGGLGLSESMVLFEVNWLQQIRLSLAKVVPYTVI